MGNLQPHKKVFVKNSLNTDVPTTTSPLSSIAPLTSNLALHFGLPATTADGTTVYLTKFTRRNSNFILPTNDSTNLPGEEK
jgi:hypothetical protein